MGGATMKPTQAATTNDEHAIRELVDTWLEASKKQDLTTLLGLLDDDVLFIVPGREPFGKKEFAAGNSEVKDFRMEAAIDIKELKVTGEWAWMRSFLNVAFKLGEDDATKLSGHILTIFRKTADGKWVIYRDANFVMPESAK
jgi:uncharacterized protein (TIGR02246 family)